MLGATFLPSRWRKVENAGDLGRFSWLSRQLTPPLLYVTRRATIHPIYTIAAVAVLASTTYMGLLESSLFEGRSVVRDGGVIDFSGLLAGSQSLYTGADTDWKWSAVDESRRGQVDDHIAVVTFVFPDTISAEPQTAPRPASVPTPSNSNASILPCSTGKIGSASQHRTLAYSMPYAEAPSFLAASHEIPASKAQSQVRYASDGSKAEEKKWIVKAVNSNSSGNLWLWARNAWADFREVLRNAETLDIIIMFFGYFAMQLTFVSVFLSMRKLGSNAWLGTTVLFSSCFAFLFALIVTTKLGVPINMILLSEGIPFLVTTVGFEKPIVLTKAVLAHALDRRQTSEKIGSGHTGSAPTIQYAVQAAIKEQGAAIVRDYMIEIAILSCGAASGVQGGLRQFCFLAAWILFFDGILLFTFYTAILTIKLEINRIKRHVALRKALEEDGVTRRVAENVASSNEWPSLGQTESGNDSPMDSEEHPVFGRHARDSSIPRFKLMMVGGFILINLFNLCSIPLRQSATPLISGLSSVVASPPVDPFKVAGSGLESILANARSGERPTMVTVFAPIKYEFEYPSIRHASDKESNRFFEGEYADQLYTGVGGRVVEGVLKSFEDPVLSKWIVVALITSLALNGYLFNAARWTIKEPSEPEQPPKESEVMDQISTPRDVRSIEASQPLILQPAPEIEPVISAAQLPGETRSTEQIEAILKAKQAATLNDNELIDLAMRGKIPGYALEKTIGDMTRAVKVRRAVVSRTHSTRETSSLLEGSKLPYVGYDYERVLGACCENVIGYMPLPLGVAGPINIDGRNYFLPMATTEGVLVASTSRGCKAINAGGGVCTVLTGDGMTRGPCVSFGSARRAGEAKVWLDSDEGQKVMKDAFNSTSRFARLQQMKSSIAGRKLFIRFKTTTGDAMGMNMISKGCEHALGVMVNDAGFEDMQIISLSGNFCIDKKAAAINWIDGRGKSVVAEATVPAETVKSVLKTTVDALVELNIAKNLVGSAMAGALGGFNAHASNLVAAVFIATGQDPAQVVESSNCITLMENINGNLHISVSMPSIEVGTIGGGTILEPQAAMLDLLGIRGPHPTNPGENSRQLAKIVASAVLAGELSLASALAAGHLVRAHMSHNRSAATSAAPSRAQTPAPIQTPTSFALKEGLKITSSRSERS